MTKQVQAQHTSGPWTVQALEDRRHGYDGWSTFAVRDARNVCVATVGEVDRAMSESALASARLIAAAPDLLAVAEFVAKMCELDSTLANALFARSEASYETLQGACLAAIAKARGEGGAA